MSKEEIYLMMLRVLDDPTGVRIIVETKYPDFSDQNGTQNAYFMIDHGDCGVSGDRSSEVEFDYWQVSDSLGQSKKFNSNGKLIEFIQSIESIVTKAWVESF